MDIVCFSHLRWDFVYQRPQHLMARFASEGRVFFWEEPKWEGGSPHVSVSTPVPGVFVLVPCLPADHPEQDTEVIKHRLLMEIMREHNITEYIAWFYSPMFIDHLNGLPLPAAVVYDCMDELSAFKGAPPALREKEQELFRTADIVFTGGNLLYETKKPLHKNIYAFPSSIDKEHFRKARQGGIQPEDQRSIAGIKIGFFGVIDERMNIQLIDELSQHCPDWNIILVGPVVKIDPATLPQRSNIFYIGGRSYEQLPGYLSGWDVAMIPFALNESTRFISPTKTPEYLAGGKPVVSAAIHDVLHPYGDLGLVYIADSREDFINGIRWCLTKRHDASWLQKVDEFLDKLSWDETWQRMKKQVEDAAAKKRGKQKEAAA